MKKIIDKLNYNSARRHFIKQTAVVGAAEGIFSPMGKALGSLNSSGGQDVMLNPIGFNGERRDPVTGCYHLGNGYRMYNPGLMRFHAADSMSPFGKGGVNSYAYCLGDPVNLRDPSGHFALLSLLIGAIIGAVAGAAISAVAEGIQSAINPEHKFDWKQVGIGAALGFISGGFGAAAQGAKTSVQVGLAVGDAFVSGGADFGLNVAAGVPIKQAGLNAGVGAVIGLATFGIGSNAKSIRKATWSLVRGRQGNSLSTLNSIVPIEYRSTLNNRSPIGSRNGSNSRTPIGYHGTSAAGAAGMKNNGVHGRDLFIAPSYSDAKFYSDDGTVLKVFSNDVSVLRNTSSWRAGNAQGISELVVKRGGFENLSFEYARSNSVSSFSGVWVRMGLKTQQESVFESVLAYRATIGL